mgnify:CR=1 FL=1
MSYKIAFSPISKVDEESILSQIPDKFVYQSFPSVRFHLPNDQAIHYWHCDSDKDHMHPEWEINFHLSLTNIEEETQAMWVESVHFREQLH